MEKDRFHSLRQLTEQDRKEIYQFAMKRSEEILKGINTRKRWVKNKKSIEVTV